MRLGLGFVGTGETVYVACISNSGIGFLPAEVFEEVPIPDQSLEQEVKRYRSGKQYKLLQPSAVQIPL